MCVFSADYLALKSVCSSQEKTISPALNVSVVFFCVGSKPHELLPIHFGISAGVILVQLISCWLDLMGVASDIARSHNFTAKSLVLCLL